MSEWLAHSKGENPSVPAQTYKKHILGVLARVEENIKCISPYYEGDFKFFEQTVRTAALFHDLGKLDDANQKVLSENSSRGLPVNHVDAGTANLVEKDLVESAFLIYSHHRGLNSIPEEIAKEELFLRDPNLFSYTEQYLTDYISKHTILGFEQISKKENSSSDWTGLTRRIALSCLVDADFSDTANNYGKECPIVYPKPRWKERLEALDQYVDDLSNDCSLTNERHNLLQRIYKCCRDADTQQLIYACDSPVGTGKTTAVMAHLLRVALDNDLRHIIVVLPYTNIIKQSVDVYRKSLVLPDENKMNVVAEHHHQVDFEDLQMRQLSVLWKAPIIITTAVQFFETIASNKPSKLRKLCELPGSGIFIDETHAAIPTHLWPQTWKWIKTLTEDWGCHFVLASGSLPKFWELGEIVEAPEKIPDLVEIGLRDQAIEYEKKRVTPIHVQNVLNSEELIDLVLSKPSPRLVILNTVQSAAVIADLMAKRIYKDDYTIELEKSKVLHLSTSLTPHDREPIIETVQNRLKSINDEDRDFTLIATSCVEAGLDFSFRSAFRQSASAASLIQIGGRVRRRNEDFDPILIDFRIEDHLINSHPAFTLSSQILNKLLDEGKFLTHAPADLTTEALRRELMSDTMAKHKEIQRKENDLDYPSVARLYKVITDNTVLIVIDKELIIKLEKGEKIDPQEINRKSVRIWTDKMKKTCAYPIERLPGLYGWPEEQYDGKFLGYMKGILYLLKFEIEGSIII